MKTYKILIVEDDLDIGESLKEILECLNNEVVTVARSYEEAKRALSANNFDLATLDIQLQGVGSGFDVADLINRNHHIPYVFTTAFADEGTIEIAKDKYPYGYVVKPYGIKDVHVAVELAMSLRESKYDTNNIDQSIFVRYNGRLVKISLNELLWIEAKGDYALFKTIDKGYLVHATIKSIDKQLQNKGFIKVHRSYIVNKSMVDDIEETNLMIREKIIPISRGNKNTLLTSLNLLA